MNIHDLRIILGPDNILRRKFCFLNKTTLSMEEYISNQWISNIVSFDITSASFEYTIKRYNIRSCVFYTTHKKINQYPIYLFSQQEVR